MTPFTGPKSPENSALVESRESALSASKAFAAFSMVLLSLPSLYVYLNMLDLYDSQRISLRVQFLTSVQRYFYHFRKSNYPLSARVLVLVHALEAAQVLSLLFPAHSPLPWSYESFGYVWSALSVCRGDFLLGLVGVSEESVFIGVATVVAVKTASAVAAAAAFAGMENMQFDAWMSATDKKAIVKSALLADFVLHLLLFRACSLWVCALLFRCLWVSASLRASSALVLVLYLSETLAEASFTGTTSWLAGDFDSVSSPQAHVQMKAATIAFCAVASTVDFSTHDMLFAACLCVIGTFHTAKLLWTIPYHHSLRNILELQRALVPLWGGIVLLVSVLVDPGRNSVLATVLFVFPLPFVLVLLAGVMRRRTKTLGKALHPEELFHFELILRYTIATGSDQTAQVDSAFLKMAKLFPKAGQLTVWAIHFYHHAKDVTFVQVNVSRLLKVPWGFFSYMECYNCYRTTEAWLRTQPDHAESIAFWHYQQNLGDMQRRDYAISKIHSELFHELSGDSFRHSRAMRLARMLSEESIKYDRFVQSVVKTHPVCPELLSVYSSYLTSLTNMKQAGKYKGLARRVADILKANRNENAIDLFDSDCMVMAMSLEASSIGTVLWAKNPDLLGFTISEMVGADHSLIIPDPLKHSHVHMLSRISRFRHHHPVYESRHRLYFMHKDGHLIPAHWKVRLVNLPVAGDLCVIAALKKRKETSAIAFVDERGKTVTAMVRGRQTLEFRKKLREAVEIVQDSFSLMEAFGDTWSDGKVLQRHLSPDGSVDWVLRCEVFRIFDLYPQKILSISYDYVKFDLPEVSPSVQQLHSIMFEEDNSPRKEAAAEHTETPATYGKASSFAGRQVLATFRSRDIEKKRTTFFSSLFESNATSVAVDQEKQVTHSDVWKEVWKAVKKRRVRVMRVVVWMDFATVASVLVAVVAVMSFFLVSDSVAQYSDLLEEILRLNDQRELPIIAALRVRELSDPQRFPDTATALLNLTETMKSRIRDLQDSVDAISDAREIQVEGKGIWLEASNGSFKPYLLNAMELLRQLSSHLNQLSVTRSPTGPDFLAVYRNGAESALSALNRTMKSIVDHCISAKSSEHQVYPLLVSLCIATLFLLMTTASVIGVRSIEHTRRVLWRALTQVPRAVFAAAKAVSRDRLETLHSAEWTQFDPSDSAPVYRSKKNESQYHSLPHLKWTVALLSLFVTSMIVTAVCVYTANERYFVYLSRDVPTVLYVSGLRSVTLLQSQFFARELLYSDTYFSLSSDFQQFADMTEELRKAVDCLQFYERNIAFSHGSLQLDASALNSRVFTAVFDQSDSQSSPYLTAGLHTAVVTAAVDLLTSSERLTWELVGNVEGLRTAVDNATREYRNQAVEGLRHRFELFLGVTIGAAILWGALYLLCIRVLLRSLVRCTMEEWRLLLFLPRDSAPTLLKLLKK